MEAHIREARARFDPHYVEGGVWDLQSRLRVLREALDSVDASNRELFRYFPIASIALLESYVKAVISSIIDHDSVYLERGLALIADRSLKAVEAISVIQSGTATPGQLVAHVLPFSSLAHLESSFDKLLAQSVKELLKVALDAYDVRLGRSDPRIVVSDVPGLWRKLDATFRHRHIIAHEAAPSYDVTAGDARDALDAAETFMSGIDAILWTTVWHGIPLTQRELNDEAHKEMVICRSELASVIKRLRRLGRMDALRHRFWRIYFLEYMRRTAVDMMGSIAPLIYATTAISILRHRISELEPLLQEGAIA